MGVRFMQGKYKPLNPTKYKGDANDIVYRSSWELIAFRFCDNTPEILQWSSETTVIPYISPVDMKRHRYFMDLSIWVRNHKGELAKFLVEIKPQAETRAPRRGPKKSDKTYMLEVATYAVNQAKWAAAREYCKQNGFQFIIWTERELLPGQQTFKAKKRK